MADIETVTNTFLRKKYFVDAKTVLANKKEHAKPARPDFSSVIDASKVMVSKKPVVLKRAHQEKNTSIKVNVVRDGEQITGIRIACPCGRHAELNCEYLPETAAGT